MSARLKHLLLVSTEEMSNPKAWSGIPFSLRTALERQLDRVTSFEPPRPRRTPLASAQRLLFGARRFPLWISEPTLRANARAVEAEIARVRPDAVLSISSQCIVGLKKPDVPVFLFSDAPYQAFMEAYAPWEHAPDSLPRFTHQEAAAARRIDGLCFGSAWACEEAARLYSLPAQEHHKLHVAPLGANWVPAMSRQEILSRVEKRVPGQDHLDLLFVGRDWERKGGPLAVAVTSALRARGIAARLHVVGSRPQLGAEANAASAVTIYGPLYQTDPAQSAQLADLFLRSHFLLVPTLAECFGIVFAEAQAFGLPPISRAVHALPSVVEDGISGLLFPADASADQYADRILALLRQPGAYQTMARQARLRFESLLTWDQTARHLIQAFEAFLDDTARDSR